MFATMVSMYSKFRILSEEILKALLCAELPRMEHMSFTPTLTSTKPVTHFGHRLIEHTFDMPWDPFSSTDGEKLTIFAREVFAPGMEEAPALVYLQGGPGFPAPRPMDESGLVGEALKHYRLILIDQRGTGRSCRIDRSSDVAELTVEKLSMLRQEYIVEDCEALRRGLGIEKWSLYGQSFGGFCITSYLSQHPESVEHAFLTGGLPTIDKSADDVYRSTFTKLRHRHDEFYREYPWAQDRIREIAHHLDNSQEVLPTGERLSSRRFRMLGIDLGRGAGYHNLAYLLEDPFHSVKGEKRLKTDFLATAGSALSYESGPLYGVIHESIYGGVGGAGATNWAAHRIREEFDGFGETIDPRTSERYYLTGEHIFPWQFDEDPALVPFKKLATDLAAHEWQRSPYDANVLASGGSESVTAAACVYLDDIFVPFEESMATARTYRDCRVHVTNQFQHDGIRHAGADILATLRAKIADH